MARRYQTPREHLDDELALIGALIERQIRAHWELGLLPRIKDEFSGTFVSGSEVTALLAGGLAPSPEGEKAIADLDAQITARAERIEAKLAAARASGKPLPFDQLRTTFGLTPTEERVLWVLIAVEVSTRMRQLVRYLVNESTRIHADVGLLQLLVYSSPQTRDRMLYELAPDGPLLANRLVEAIGTRRQIDDTPLLLRPLKVTDRVVELVHGIRRLDREVAPYAELIPSPPGFDELIVPDEIKTEAIELLRPETRAPRGKPHADPSFVGETPEAPRAPRGKPHADPSFVGETPEAPRAPRETPEAPRASAAVVFSGNEGAGRKSLALGAASALGVGALCVRCADLPRDTRELPRLLSALVREAVLFRAIPVFDGIDELVGTPEAGAANRGPYLDAALAGFVGPVAGTCKKRDSRPVSLSRGVLMVDVPLPTEADRSELWRRALGDSAPQLDVDHVAARYPVTGGIILRSAGAAMSLAQARGDTGGVNNDDVHAGLRSTLDSQLSVLGRRVIWRQTWDDLVLPEDAHEEIREFIARVKHRRRVYEEWGFSRKMAKGLGLSALFAGPPGTGKTMVAGIIADELALDLYQIDLSRIVSKYVGETEKNLAQLFDAAEAGHAILLFDEADSLFAKRTEVKSSVDRYANLEVNYLLQRMEGFNGITILTTNLESSIDDAFKRRISFRVNFPFPEPEDRIRLWRAMLPDEAAVADDIDYELLSERYEMSGGYIRNSVLRAAFLAADEDSPITMQHLLRAATLEYAAMGKVMSTLSH